ncbi:MAG: hypothetical protein ABSG80_09250 [Verrucomicrobiota bacterium]|jgi:hypothetical protein
MIEIIVSITQSTCLAIMKSATSGKAGGLREREPLKAVVLFIMKRLKRHRFSCSRRLPSFPGGFHDFQILHRLLFTSLLSWVWHGYLDQTI